MYRPRDIWRFLSLAVLIGLFACTDLPTSPEPVQETEEETPFFSRAPGPGIEVLRKRPKAPRPGDSGSSGNNETAGQTASKKIGPKGGVISFKDLGLRIVFPERAVSKKTRITVSVFGGSAVAFQFEPHGLDFNVPVEIRIDKDSSLLSGLDFRGDESGDTDLVGVYFLGDPASGVTPLEILPIYLDGDDFVLEISHFSGYAVASD